MAGRQPEDLDSHLTSLGASSGNRMSNRRSNQRMSNQRLSNRRSSAAMSVITDASDNRRQSFTNVTDSFKLSKVNEEITDTERSLQDIAQEIQNIERRRSRRASAGTLSQFGDSTEFKTPHMRPKTFRPLFSIFLLLFCVIMFVAEIAVNDWTVEDVKYNPLIGPSVDVLVELGAKDTDLIQGGEWWRLISPIVLHVGIVHLLSNMLGLVVIGIPMEQEFGSLRFATVVLSSGFFGVVMSALFAPHIIGVGASGAIFGLFGAAWADLIQNWDTYRGRNKRLLAQLVVYTFFNFFIGLMPYLDNWAHLGGFICGLIVGLALLVKQYGEFGERGDYRKSYLYQITLRVTAVIVLPVLVSVMTGLLFVGVDFIETCGFCSYVSCVEFPIGAKQEDLWWQCTPCTNGQGDYNKFEAGQVNIICPNSTEIPIFIGPISEEEFDKDFILFCQQVCES